MVECDMTMLLIVLCLALMAALLVWLNALLRSARREIGDLRVAAQQFEAVWRSMTDRIVVPLCRALAWVLVKIRR